MPNALLLEWKRQAIRPGVLLGSAAYLGLSALALFYFGPPLLFETYLWIAYLILPMLAAPFGAALASRDRDLGFSSVLATLPLTRSRRIGAHLSFIIALCTLLSLPMLPLTWIGLAPYGSLALARGLEFAGWGFALAFIMACVGYTIGESFRARAAVCVSAAFLAALLAFAMGAGEAPAFGMLARTFGETSSLVILHLSPVTWAMDDLSLSEQTHFTPALAFLGSATAAAFIICLLSVVGTLKETQFKFPHNRTRRVVLLSAVVIAIICLGNLALGAYSEPVQASEPPRYTETNNGLRVSAVLFRDTPTHPTFSVRNHDIVTLRVAFYGTPNASVVVNDFRMTAETTRYVVLDQFPATIQLNEKGFVFVTVRSQPEPIALQEALDTVSVEFTANGVPFGVTATALRVSEPLTDSYLTAPVAFIAVSGTAGTAFVLPRRLNAW